MANAYDVVVIGAGTGGYVAAIRAAQLGKKVAVVEKQKALGGTCLIWGCIPTKALLEHAHALKVVQNAKEWGVTIPAGTPAIDMGQVHARKDKIVSGLTKGIEFLFKKNKIDWIKGTARLAGNGRVDVFEGDKQTLEAKEIIVATGSAPRSVPGIEIDHKRIITSDEAIHLQGGAEVAGDHGQRRGRRGVRLHLPPVRQRGHDHRAAAAARARRGRGGVGGAREVVQEAGHQVADRHEGDQGGGDRQGRRHRSADARRKDAEAVGRDPARRHRPRSGDDRPRRRGARHRRWRRATSRSTSCIGPRCRTSRRSATSSRWAVRAHPQLAHVSSMEGILVAERLAGKEVQPLNYDHVPGCTYCDPEIGSVGLTEAEAKQRGYDVRIGAVSVRRARPRQDGRRDRGVRQDRRRQEVR